MANIEDIRPLTDRIVVEIVEREERSAGGIYIPPTAKDQTLVWLADVLAVGPGKLLKSGARLEPEVKVGDRIILAKYLGKEMRLENGKIVIIRGDDVDGIIEQE